MTDTDRELLELAAKAAGGQVRFDYSPDRAPWLQSVVAGKPQPYPVRWNPLTDDGDALRLAVRLRLHAKHFSPLDDDFDTTPHGMVEVWQEDGGDPLHIEYFKRGDDRLIITRLAITRAAAEIGKAMP